MSRREIFLECNEVGSRRLDLFLASRLRDQYSREFLQGLIKGGEVYLNSKIELRPSAKVKEGDTILVRVPEPSPYSLTPRDIPFNIVYQDDHIAVIDKPPGIVVHPGAGNYENTLVHGLLYRLKDLSGIGGTLRPGIVHRLDKGTSGLMIVAKSDMAHGNLAKAFKQGEISKEYLAISFAKEGLDSGVVDAPILRDRFHRKKMKVDQERGKRAITFWKVITRSRYGFLLLQVRIASGRTHQIRVHLSYMGMGILGDDTYGVPVKRLRQAKALESLDLSFLEGIQRPMLHSFRIGFPHPISQTRLEFSSSPPEDMAKAIEVLFGKEWVPQGALFRENRRDPHPH